MCNESFVIRQREDHVFDCNKENAQSKRYDEMNQWGEELISVQLYKMNIDQTNQIE